MFGPQGVDKFSDQTRDRFKEITPVSTPVRRRANVSKSVNFEPVKAETIEGKSYVKNYLPVWKEIINVILNHKGKSNLIEAAVQGGYRLDRRFKNMNKAFTYGVKFTYDDLDNPKLMEKI